MDLALFNYRRLNNITGWLMFLISAVVYILTVEPTVSFWDCGEFILCSFGLQVGHPPGAPLFVMIGRVATLFAGGDTSNVALTMNILSALCSAFAIMFLYWTITHLARRIFSSVGSFGQKQIPAVIGSGVIGALAYTFSDTFWFSAVEGELYAMSSLILGIAFWAMLKWEEEADQAGAGRWIILTAFIMGMGLGIHRLNLLIIPVAVFVYYFRKYDVTRNGLIYATGAAMLLVGIMVFLLIPGVPMVASWFELFFINILRMPYNTGLMVFIVSIIALIILGIRYSVRSQKVVLNYAITAFAVIMIGYSSYAMIMIRSSARPPMNQNNPSDIFSLSYYINMQQYGSSPKLHGTYYSAPVTDVKQVVAGYNKINGKYEPYYRPEYEYDKNFETIFPRMYSSVPEHKQEYVYWGKITGRRYTMGSGANREVIVSPTFGENLRFFFRYQVGFMYLRYFMWNFAGRQNDMQANGNSLQGNWISGINFIDEARLGPLDEMPTDVKENPARNTYFFLPLLIGLAGLLWQYKRDRNGFILVMAFFIMTGLAIILYLNQNPSQPRERDYAYAGSFYAFAIWIGLGFMFVWEKLSRFIDSRLSAAITFVLLFVSVPLLMGTQNWDDHDRSDRYTAMEIGANYLRSCAPNAVLFTYGDNDSFPVWYVQDVEGIRTDVRVANLSYLQAGWYIDMMRQKAFESDPLPLSLPSEKYLEGMRTQLPVEKRINRPVDISEIVKFAGNDDKQYMIDVSGRGDYLNYLPSQELLIPVDTASVLANGTVKEYYRNKIISPIIWKYSDDNAFKGDLAIMDLLATNKWERPVYFSTTVPSDQYKGLEKYFVQEGMAYRIVPVNTAGGSKGDYGIIDPDVMYHNMMNEFRWGNAEDPDVYLDENNRRMFSNFRRLFANLGKTLIASGDTVRALEVVKRGMEIVPSSKMPDDFFYVGMVEVLYRAGKVAEADQLAGSIVNYSREYLEYAISIPAEKRYGLDYSYGINMQALLDLYNMAGEMKNNSLIGVLEPVLSKYYSILYSGKQ